MQVTTCNSELKFCSWWWNFTEITPLVLLACNKAAALFRLGPVASQDLHGGHFKALQQQTTLSQEYLCPGLCIGHDLLAIATAPCCF